MTATVPTPHRPVDGPAPSAPAAPPARRVPIGPLVRLERRLLHGLVRLPPALIQRVSRPPVGADSPLDPQLQLVLTLRRRRGYVSLAAGTPERTRELVRQQAFLTATRRTPVGAVRDLTVPGAVGPLPARHYAPPLDAAGAPLLVFLHGGGFVAGDLDSHDEPCRLLCRYGRMHVLSVDYRLAPEHPFPAAVEDTHAALAWALDSACHLGADPARVAVGGDSAGANLATVATLLTIREQRRRPAAQILLYPPTEHRDWPSRSAYGDGFLLSLSDIDWFHSQYAPQAVPGDFRHTPRLAPDLSGLPPVLLVTAAFDPLRDEGEAYAAALREAGTRVVSWRAPGMVHGFANMTTLSRAARYAMVRVAQASRRLLTEEVSRG